MILQNVNVHWHPNRGALCFCLWENLVWGFSQCFCLTQTCSATLTLNRPLPSVLPSVGNVDAPRLWLGTGKPVVVHFVCVCSLSGVHQSHFLAFGSLLQIHWPFWPLEYEKLLPVPLLNPQGIEWEVAWSRNLTWIFSSAV